MYGDRLGVDIGGVVISRTVVDGRFAPLPGVFDALKRLQSRFDEIVLVSRVNDVEHEADMMKWLNFYSFWEQTGVLRENIHFCRQRHEKMPICQRRKITHFVDDRTEVLWHLRECVNNLYLFQGRQEEMKPREAFLPRLVQVSSWEALLMELAVAV